MADTTTVSWQSGKTLYDVFTQGTNIWAGTSALVAISGATWSSVAAAGLRAEIGSTGFYGPPDLTDLPAGEYNREVRLQIDASPAITDPVIFLDEDFGWDGSGELSDFSSGEDLTTASRYKTYANITVSTYDTAIGYLVTAASLAILKYCDRDSFKTTTYSGEIYNGTGQWFLKLRNTPISSITSLVLHADSTTDTTTYAGSNFIYESKTGEVRWDRDATTTERFPRGFQNIQANYIAGLASIPADLELAAWQVIKHYFSVAQVNPTLKSEKIGDYSYTNFEGAVTSTDIGSDPALDKVRTILASGGYYRPHWN